MKQRHPLARRGLWALAGLCCWWVAGGCSKPAPPSTPILPPPEAAAPKDETPSTEKESPVTEEPAEAPAQPVLIALPPEGGELYSPLWSPGGNRLVFASFVEDTNGRRAHASVHLYTVATGKLTTLVSRSAERDTFHRFEGLAWSPGGRAVVVSELVGPYESEGDVLGWVLPDTGKKPQPLPGDTERACWSPDGKRLARLRLDQSSDEPHHFVDVLPADATSEDDAATLVKPGVFEFIDELSWRPGTNQVGLVAARGLSAVLAMVEVTAEPRPARVIAQLGQQFAFGAALTWLPDGRHVVLADQSSLLVVDLDTGEVERREQPGEVVGYSADAEVVVVLIEDRLCVVLPDDDRPQQLIEVENIDELPVEAAFSTDLSKLAFVADGKLWLHRFAQG